MNIVQGRGKRRTVLELPAGEVFARAAEKEPANYLEVHEIVCQRLGVTR